MWAAKVNRILHECTFHSYEQKLKAKMESAISNQSPQSKTLEYSTTTDKYKFPFKEIFLEDQLHNSASWEEHWLTKSIFAKSTGPNSTLLEERNNFAVVLQWKVPAMRKTGKSLCSLSTSLTEFLFTDHLFMVHSSASKEKLSSLSLLLNLVESHN